MKDDYKGFTLRLMEERMRCGLTQQQLCECVGMAQSVFSRAETGGIRLAFPRLKRLCTSGMDIFYAFTGSRAEDWLEFPDSAGISPEEYLSFLGIVYIYADIMRNRCRSRMSSGASGNECSYASREAAFGQIREQLTYLQYLSGTTRVNRSIFYCLRNHYGYTQEKMADILGIDIKKLRNLEKGRQFPDSEVIWELYDQFRVSPVFILNDSIGLYHELNHALGLLEADDRAAVQQILKSVCDPAGASGMEMENGIG